MNIRERLTGRGPSGAAKAPDPDAQPAAWELNPEQKTYLTKLMDQVSRSFAVVVSYLEQPLRDYVATAYLLCRVVDNIEDCGEPHTWKQRRFAEFMRLLNEPGEAAEVLPDWAGQPWPALTEHERRMMAPENGAMLWQIYASIPAAPRAIIRRWAVAIANGMSALEDPGQAPHLTQRDGVQMLARESDYNSYCYFVAGTVGHMATELVIGHYALNGDAADALLATCEACGRGLQKTNIVKDFAEDLGRGMSYLPEEWLREVSFSPLSLADAPAAWKRKVLDDVMAELRLATTYVLALPYGAVGYRMASLMCLLPAYQTILLAAREHDRLFTPRHHVKISRVTLAHCMQEAKSMVADNGAVAAYSQKIAEAVSAAFRDGRSGGKAPEAEEE